jgi:hypothetical protein
MRARWDKRKGRTTAAKTEKKKGAILTNARPVTA